MCYNSIISKRNKHLFCVLFFKGLYTSVYVTRTLNVQQHGAQNNSSDDNHNWCIYLSTLS